MRPFVFRTLADAAATIASVAVATLLVAAAPASAHIGPSISQETSVVDPATLARGVERIGGADRYVVSAAVSREFTHASLVFVASGETFPDALSTAAAAGIQNAPVLLVQKDAVPAPITAELRRLKPDVIVIVGGTSAVSAPVEDTLGDYADEVERVAGADRYEVSARLSAQTLWPPAPVVYVVSGEGYADALSGSAAAGALGGPVLLVHKDTIPGAIALELARLRPSKIVVLGGTNAISDAVVTTLAGVVRDTIRIDGADRYKVSAATSAHTFPIGAKTVFIASGTGFPDALSGSAAAIHAHGPMLLVTATGIPAAIATELTRLRPTRIVVLGGDRTVSDAVVAGLARYLAP